jgi:hypothetical protein
MRKRHACFAAAVVGGVSLAISACVSPQVTMFAEGQSECRSYLARKGELAGQLRQLDEQVFKQGRSACADLTKIYSLKKAINSADAKARKMCPPSSFAGEHCDQRCLEEDLARVASTKEKYCSYK